MTHVLSELRIGPDEIARAAAAKTLHALAPLKNVPLEPERASQLVERVLSWLNPSEFEQLAAYETAGMAALARAANIWLDITVQWEIAGRIRDLESTSSISAAVEGMVRAVKAEAADKTCVRWPDLGDLIARYYGERVEPGRVEAEHV